MPDWRALVRARVSAIGLDPLALSGQDALVQARVIRAGKSLAFGEIDIRGATDGKSACRATTTYALL